MYICINLKRVNVRYRYFIKIRSILSIKGCIRYLLIINFLILYRKLPLKFFENDGNKWIVSEILSYHEEYRKPPTLDVFKSQLTKIDNEVLKKTVVEQLRHVFTQVGNVDLEYIKDEFTNFCINQNLKGVILQSVDLLKAGSYDRIKDLVDKGMKVGQESDLGMDYIEDYESRTEELNRTTVPTRWKPINDLWMVDWVQLSWE